MNRIPLLTLMFALSLNALGARAASCPDIREENLDSFAQATLGANLRSIPHDSTRSTTCLVEASSEYTDCEFVDSQGAAYLVEGKQITRIEYRAANSKNIGKTPLGLHFGMPISAVVEVVDLKLRKPNLVVAYVDDHIAISTGLCFKDKKGELSELYFEFDRAGLLRTFGQRMEAGSD